MAQQGNVTTQVETIFAAVAKGDASGTDDLLALGDAVVPAVSKYLFSEDDNVRTEAVMLLAALDTEAAANALLPALSDRSADIRERAARAVLMEVLRKGTFVGLGAAAMKGLAAGEPGAAALLLGAFSDRSGEILRGTVDSTRLVKLADSDLPVRAGLPAQVALSRQGDGPARAELSETIERDDLAELLFLLDVLPLVDDPSLINALAAQTLDDERPVAGGVPAGVEPSRRVADRAVDALAERLQPKLSFKLDATKRYSETEIAELRKAVGSAIPL